MRILKYIGVISVLVFFTGCMDNAKIRHFNLEGDNLYYNKDYINAARNYEEAAKGDSPYAYYKLYDIYFYDKSSIYKDLEYAKEVLQKAVDLGDYRAEYLYALKLLYSPTPDYTKAKEILELSAQKEFPQAYLELGYLYLYGLGVPSSRKKAIEYFDIAQSHGLKIPTIETMDSYKELYSRKMLIKEVQRNLTILGLYKGKIDGIVGPLTKKAVRGFQTTNLYSISEKVTNELLNQTIEELSR